MQAIAEKPKILVIDDEFGPRESIRFLFKDKYDVHCADSVNIGLGYLRDQAPDVIILDIKMPGKSGIEGLGEIRELDHLVSVIMLTGFGNLETAQKAIRLGATDYIKKPFDTREMRDVVARYIGQTQIARKRHATARSLESLNQKLSEDLEDRQHMATLGEASTELIHDLRNPLTIISGYVQLLMQDIENMADTESDIASHALDYLQLINKNVHRCHEMAEMWRSLGKKEIPDLHLADIDSFIAEAFEQATALCDGSPSQVQLRPGKAQVKVNIDSLQLSRAMMNLVSNALEALPPDGGLVMISWHVDETTVTIRVEDNGCGIPEDMLESVCNAYITTKDESGGMGIGLFITKKAIAVQGGTFTIENKPEGGVMASIILPLPDTTPR